MRRGQVMPSRRQYLRRATATGGAAILGLSAGCASGGNDGGGGDGGGGDGGGGDGGDGGGGGNGNGGDGGGSTGGGGDGPTIGVLSMLQLDVGVATKRGVELAARKINDEGMLDGEVTVESADTEGKSTAAVEAHNSLVNRQNADVTLGTFAEQTAAAIMPEIASSEKMHLNVGAISPKLPAKVAEDYESYKPWFRIAPPNAAFFVVDMATFAEQFLVGDQGWTTTAIFREDAAWTDQVGGALKEQFPKLGLEVKDDIVFSLSETSFNTYMDQIENMDVDCVYGLIAEAGKAPLLSYEKAGLTTPMVGALVAAQSPQYLSDVNAETSPIINQTFSTWGADHRSAGEEFVDAYTSAYDSRPSKPTWSAFGGYAATMMYAKARAESGGGLDATVSAMEGTSFELDQHYSVYEPGETAEATGGTYPHDLKYGSDHFKPMWSQWQGGELKTVYPDKFSNADYQTL
jgi:branched-chain amino acid transport system substrate-binding protein